MKINKAIISAPFGTYLQLKNTTSTRGTYTYDRRDILKSNSQICPSAIWGALTRIEFTSKGIYNRMGLRNPGIKSQDFEAHRNAIWSINGCSYNDWMRIIDHVPAQYTVELNLSCPNVKDYGIYPAKLHEVFEEASLKFDDVIVKLAPRWESTYIARMAWENGIKKFHCCNTLKTERGGLSGRAIQAVSMPLMCELRKLRCVELIAGGGIYSAEDVKKYRMCGASYYSLGTIFMRCPWRLPEVLAEINK